jgi:hypothetical protein
MIWAIVIYWIICMGIMFGGIVAEIRSGGYLIDSPGSLFTASWLTLLAGITLPVMMLLSALLVPVLIFYFIYESVLIRSRERWNS